MMGAGLMCRTAHLPPQIAMSPCSHMPLVGMGREVQPCWVQRVGVAVPGPGTDEGESGWACRGADTSGDGYADGSSLGETGTVILPMGPIIISIW